VRRLFTIAIVIGLSASSVKVLPAFSLEAPQVFSISSVKVASWGQVGESGLIVDVGLEGEWQGEGEIFREDSISPCLQAAYKNDSDSLWRPISFDFMLATQAAGSKSLRLWANASPIETYTLQFEVYCDVTIIDQEANFNGLILKSPQFNVTGRVLAPDRSEIVLFRTQKNDDKGRFLRHLNPIINNWCISRTGVDFQFGHWYHKDAWQFKCIPAEEGGAVALADLLAVAVSIGRYTIVPASDEYLLATPLSFNSPADIEWGNAIVMKAPKWPTNLMWNNVSVHTAELSWDSPTDHGDAPILGFVLKKVNSGLPHSVWTISADKNSIEIDLPLGSPSVEYTLETFSKWGSSNTVATSHIRPTKPIITRNLRVERARVSEVPSVSWGITAEPKASVATTWYLCTKEATRGLTPKTVDKVCQLQITRSGKAFVVPKGSEGFFVVSKAVGKNSLGSDVALSTASLVQPFYSGEIRIQKPKTKVGFLETDLTKANWSRANPVRTYQWYKCSKPTVKGFNKLIPTSCKPITKATKSYYLPPSGTSGYLALSVKAKSMNFGSVTYLTESLRF
jgi:hypothetical protein